MEFLFFELFRLRSARMINVKKGVFFASAEKGKNGRHALPSIQER